MTAADFIALGIIFFLLFCAVRYMVISHKKGGCTGCCSGCSRKCERNKKSK